jgi:hypothetical protein
LKWGKNSKRKTKKTKPLYPKKGRGKFFDQRIMRYIGEQNKNPLLKKLASPHIYIHTDEINITTHGMELC